MSSIEHKVQAEYLRMLADGLDEAPRNLIPHSADETGYICLEHHVAKRHAEVLRKTATMLEDENGWSA